MKSCLQIPPQEKASPSVDLNFDELPIERTLGLKWNTEKDCFRFSVYSHQTPESTKRGVLSRLSTVFDPLGLLDPYMLPAKCLIQSLWRKNKDWDEPLDEGDQSVWKDWLEDLMRLSELELPRCFCVNTCMKWALVPCVTLDTHFLMARLRFRLLWRGIVWHPYSS